MENILSQINSVVGVKGSFLCSEDGTITASAVPDAFSQSDLAGIGRVVAQTISGLLMARRKKVRDIEVVYPEVRVVAKNLGKGCVCILGAPELNVAFLNLTADLAIRDMKQAMKGPDQVAPAKGAPVQAVPAEPAPAPKPVGHTLVRFLELLLAELEGRGIARKDLAKILAHRIQRLEKAHPYLAQLVSADYELDLASLRLDAVNPREAAEGLAALIHGLCFSLRGMMGEKEADEAYTNVYDAYYAEHRADFISLGLGDRLRNIVHQPLPPALTGVDIHLD